MNCGRKMKSMKSNNRDMETSKLPEELIMIILMRLPAKSVVRFRCVRKSWCALIKDPYFIKKHLKHVTSMENEFESGILSDVIVSTKATTVFYSMGIYKKEVGNANNPIELSVKYVDFPVQYKPYNAEIRACCDGILCITLNRKIVLLWNPSIKVYKRLSSPRQADTMYIYGIGYDPSTDDYKVVRASSRLRVQNYSHSSMEVFALKSNSWKTIQNNFPYEIENCDLPTFNNGCIHWVAKRATTKETVIVSFDVVIEKLGEVPLPHSEDKNRTIALLLFGGDLRFVETHYGGQIALWVMKVYGVRESWMKLLTIPQRREVGRFYEPIMPFCFTRNGLILLRERTNKFVMCNLIDDTFKSFTIDNFVGFLRIIPYVESLVSPICSNIKN